MKITNTMISKWARAGLLVVFGIILLIYNGAVIEEFEQLFWNLAPSDASMFFSLLSAILWIIALWCFVSAALNVITSFREEKLTIDDLGAKIDAIEKRLSEGQPATSTAQKKPIVVEQAKIGTEPSEVKPTQPDVPPPPP